MTGLGKQYSMNLKQELHKALSPLEPFQTCAFLDYPNHQNVGDHLIWLGGLSYLTDTLKVEIKYSSSVVDFSAEEMEKAIGDAPIILHGGGNLGDLWPRYQKFREEIIVRYPKQPIIIFPQAIFFQDKANLETAAKAFNSHPNLTVITRDQYSYNLALNNFYNCKNILAPDMAFQLAEMPGIKAAPESNQSILYQCRGDHELNEDLTPSSISLPHLVSEDWTSFKEKSYPPSLSVPGVSRIFSDAWKQGEIVPIQWTSQRIWKYFHPYAANFKTLPLSQNHLESLRYMHHGVYQFRKHRLVITTRLHGHILCVLMGIPHVVIPNSYHKIRSFYETWTYRVPFCKLIDHPSQVKTAAESLLDAYYHKKTA
ncbi:MAG: polysaccharide pyruvyl transferase family protein [Leptolyngbya sp. BL-A-14]